VLSYGLTIIPFLFQSATRSLALTALGGDLFFFHFFSCFYFFVCVLSPTASALFHFSSRAPRAL
jgi:hypothetical protein